MSLCRHSRAGGNPAESSILKPDRYNMVGVRVSSGIYMRFSGAISKPPPCTLNCSLSFVIIAKSVLAQSGVHLFSWIPAKAGMNPLLESWEVWETSQQVKSEFGPRPRLQKDKLCAGTGPRLHRDKPPYARGQAPVFTGTSFDTAAAKGRSVTKRMSELLPSISSNKGLFFPEE